MHAPVATLTGTWVPLAADISGRPLAVAQLRIARLIVERGRYRIIDHAGEVADSGELRRHQIAFPCALDIVVSHGPHAGKRLLAIIEHDGDRLRICYDLEQSQRPASMQPQADQLLLSITYARLAPERPV
jgi:uncharacterized protein (TIGR03067 family)